MGQYFEQKPTTQKDIYKFDWNIGQDKFYFYTSNSVFSKKSMDFGSMLLINTVIDENKNFKGKILDLGCGYGPVGIIGAKLIKGSSFILSDINERALELALINVKENKMEDRIKVLKSHIFDKIDEKFDIILTNPPIRAGKDVVFSFYEGSYQHLNNYGVIYVVIQKKQGAESTKEKLISLFGNCEVAAKKSGYYIFKSYKHNLE